MDRCNGACRLPFPLATMHGGVRLEGVACCGARPCLAPYCCRFRGRSGLGKQRRVPVFRPVEGGVVSPSLAGASAPASRVTSCERPRLWACAAELMPAFSGAAAVSGLGGSRITRCSCLTWASTLGWSAAGMSANICPSRASSRARARQGCAGAGPGQSCCRITVTHEDAGRPGSFRWQAPARLVPPRDTPGRLLKDAAREGGRMLGRGRSGDCGRVAPPLSAHGFLNQLPPVADAELGKLGHLAVAAIVEPAEHHSDRRQVAASQRADVEDGPHPGQLVCGETIIGAGELVPRVGVGCRAEPRLGECLELLGKPGCGEQVPQRRAPPPNGRFKMSARRRACSRATASSAPAASSPDTRPRAVALATVSRCWSGGGATIQEPTSRTSASEGIRSPAAPARTVGDNGRP